MKVGVLCTDPGHPVMPYLRRWQQDIAARGHEVELVSDKEQLSGGDVLFLVSCGQLIRPTQRAAYTAVLVLHASDLPRGRGWSPHIWAILCGQSKITVCLLEADDPVDSGRVWLRRTFTLEGHELLPEINERLFDAETTLMTEAIERFGRITVEPQQGDPGEYMRLRTPQDSRLDPDKTLAQQFELLRVVDSERYPAFMDFRGHRYVIKIEKGKADADK